MLRIGLITLINSLKPGDIYMHSKLAIIGSENGLAPAGAKPLSEQKFNIVKWTHGNKFNGIRNAYILVQEN